MIIILGVILLMLVIFVTAMRLKEVGGDEYSTAQNMPSALAQGKSWRIMKYIKWCSTLLAFSAMLGIIILIIVPLMTFSGQGYGIFKKFWLFIVVILSASFAIYPKTKYDSWLQRFLSGITLVSLPLLFMCVPFLHVEYNYLVLAVQLAIILLGATMIFLCFFLKKKARILNDKTNKIFKYMLLFPWGVFLFYLGIYILGILCVLCKITFTFRSPIFLFISYFLSLLALIVGVPAVINGGQATRGRLNLGYAGIILAQLHLLMWYVTVLYYGFVGE